MKKLMNWVLAATMICGASVFTSCTEGSDNPAPENAKDRKEFIKHTRENLKDLAENMNFASWAVANEINQGFNTTVLNNPEFEKAIIPLFIQKIRESVKEVEEGSELAEMGYKQYATIDLTEFNYRFTMKEDGSGFDVEEADDFEMITNAKIPGTNVMLNKLTLKASGDTYKQIAKRLGDEETAVVILVPSDFAFTMAANNGGDWIEGFKGAFKNNVKMSGESEFMNPKTDGLNITGKLETALPQLPQTPDKKFPADATDLYFDIANDPVANESSMKFSFVHNDKSMIDMEATANYTDKELIILIRRLTSLTSHSSLHQVRSSMCW